MDRGLRKQILCAPTGSGKTRIASYMMQSAANHGNRSLFLVDRLTLADQASDTLSEFGIPNSVVMGGRLHAGENLIKVGMMQSVEGNKKNPNKWNWVWDEADLIIVDECHTMRGRVLQRLANTRAYVVGLTATPFSEGLGNYYDRVVSVSTTNELIDLGRIVRLEAYAGVAADMSGIGGNSEFTDSQVSAGLNGIVGNIVEYWEQMTHKYRGRPMKTLMFTASVADGEKLCGAFQARGHDFRNSSYKLKPEETRKMVEQFRNDEFVGLASVEQFVKGFDVPSVECMIGARPYRKSFAAHIQQLGRVMRADRGKEYGLVLDHAGNFTRFADETEALFEYGPEVLLPGGLKKYKEVVKREENKREDIVCLRCGYIMRPSDQQCPACGMTRPKRQSQTEYVDGSLQKVDINRRFNLQRKFKGEGGMRYVWGHLLNLRGPAHREVGRAVCRTESCTAAVQGVLWHLP